MANGLGGGSRNLVSQTDSATIENAQVPRSRFQNQWSRKTAFDAGFIVPILVDEILPGDHMSYNVTAYLRLSTPLFPLLDTQRVDTFFFFVPARLLWVNWNKFMGEQDNPSDSIAFTIPVVNGKVGGADIGGMADHMGIPTVGQITAGQKVDYNALPMRAYNLIWNQWFRDENIMTSAPVALTNGPDLESAYALLPRSKSHDYFTSALPWPQKFTAPTVPLAGFAPVTGIGVNRQGDTHTGPTIYDTANPGGIVYGHAASHGSVTLPPWAAGAVSYFINETGPGGTRSGVPQIYADLAQSTGVAINVLRQAWSVQALLERDARGGTRYVEKIRSHFGVVSPDFRLQRAEYIGGGQSPLNITPIAQTAPTTGVPLGALGAAGTAAGQHRASYAATEHGYILGLINVRSELSYQQGLARLWTRSTMYDFYWPTLAGLGEQTILTKEIYATGVAANDNNVFGYQERWQEYRTRYSDVTGIMRSVAAGTLDAWHLAQRFLSAPVLSTAFISDLPPMTRVLAAGALSTNQQYIADILYQRTAVRPIPTFGTPVQLGRF
jgi:hypothetical protein